MTIHPETKSNQLFTEITGLLRNCTVPDVFTLNRLKREAKAIINNANIEQGYAMLGVIAWLEVDSNACKKHFNNAIKSGNDVATYINYAKALLSLGFINDAYQLIETSMVKYKSHPDYIESAMDIAFQSGRLDKIDTLFQSLKKLKPNDALKKASKIKDDSDSFIAYGISDQIAIKLLNIAAYIIKENNLRVNSRSYLLNDSDIDTDLYYWLKVNAGADKVADMNIELSECLAEDSTLTFENSFCIAFRSM